MSWPRPGFHCLRNHSTSASSGIAQVTWLNDFVDGSTASCLTVQTGSPCYGLRRVLNLLMEKVIIVVRCCGRLSAASYAGNADINHGVLSMLECAWRLI